MLCWGSWGGGPELAGEEAWDVAAGARAPARGGQEQDQENALR